MEVEQLLVRTKVHKDRMEAKAKRIAELEAKRYNGKSSAAVGLLAQAITVCETTTKGMEIVVKAIPTKDVISCSMDVQVDMFRLLEAFADGMIKAMEGDKKKGGKK